MRSPPRWTPWALAGASSLLLVAALAPELGVDVLRPASTGALALLWLLTVGAVGGLGAAFGIDPDPRDERSEGGSPTPRSRGMGGPGKTLIFLRSVAIVSLALVVGTATAWTSRVAPERAPALWGLIGALALLNLGAYAAERRGPSAPARLALTLIGDTIVLGGLVHQAGGLDNPFAGFFAFPGVVASAILPARPARAVLGGSVAMIAALVVIEGFGLSPPGCLFDAHGRCREAADPLASLAAGVAVSLLAGVCSALVSSLIGRLHAERDRLTGLRGEVEERATHLEAVRAELSAARTQLSSIVDNMADAVVFASPSGEVLLHNRAAAGLWAGRPGAAQDLRVCHDRARWDAMLEALANPGPGDAHPVLVIGGRSYEATYARVTSPEGVFLGAVMVARDITERLAEAQSNITRERLATVGKLAASLAHEINNPLGAISLFTEHAMKKLRSDAELHEHLGTVKKNADQCKKIVRDLLEYARQRPPARSRFPVAELIGQTQRTLEPYATRAKVELSVEIGAEVPAEAMGDPDQLRQALVNLGLNAIDAAGPGGRVRLRVQQGEQALSICVSDTGPGLTHEVADKIFTAFYTTKDEGTGLGLVVARDIAVAHGGRLWHDRAHRPGCRFVLELPGRATG